MINVVAFLLALTVEANTVPGRYVLQAEQVSCTVILQSPAPVPPEVQLEQDSVSGFVLAAPNCPGGTERAMLWRYSVATGQLELVDAAGVPVFSGIAGERGWSGNTPSNSPINLLRR